MLVSKLDRFLYLSKQAPTASIQRLNVSRDPGWSPRHQAHSRAAAAERCREQPSEAENPRCSNSTRTRLSLFIVELDCRERAFFAPRSTRRAYLRVGVQASLSAIGARCTRVGSPRAGVRPIQRLNSGPPAPLSQPHSVSRSCARRSQTREAEAADSARGPRGARAALETCRSARAARRAPSSERPVLRDALPVVEAQRVNEHESLGGHARRARHIDLHNSAARAQGQRGEDVLGSLLG